MLVFNATLINFLCEEASVLNPTLSGDVLDTHGLFLATCEANFAFSIFHFYGMFLENCVSCQISLSKVVCVV